MNACKGGFYSLSFDELFDDSEAFDSLTGEYVKGPRH